MRECRGATICVLAVCRVSVSVAGFPLKDLQNVAPATSYLGDTDLGLETQGYRKKCLQHKFVSKSRERLPKRVAYFAFAALSAAAFSLAAFSLAAFRLAFLAAAFFSAASLSAAESFPPAFSVAAFCLAF